MPEVAHGHLRKEKFIDRHHLTAGKSVVLTVIWRLSPKAWLMILTNFPLFEQKEYCAGGICVICGIALAGLPLRAYAA